MSKQSAAHTPIDLVIPISIDALNGQVDIFGQEPRFPKYQANIAKTIHILGLYNPNANEGLFEYTGKDTRINPSQFGYQYATIFSQELQNAITGRVLTDIFIKSKQQSEITLENTEYNNLGEFIISYIAFTVFGDPQNTSTILNSSEIINRVIETQHITQKLWTTQTTPSPSPLTGDIVIRIMQKIFEMSRDNGQLHERLRNITNQIMKQDPSRFTNITSTSSKWSPIPFYPDDKITFNIVFKNFSFTIGNKNAAAADENAPITDDTIVGKITRTIFSLVFTVAETKLDYTEKDLTKAYTIGYNEGKLGQSRRMYSSSAIVYTKYLEAYNLGAAYNTGYTAALKGYTIPDISSYTTDNLVDEYLTGFNTAKHLVNNAWGVHIGKIADSASILATDNDGNIYITGKTSVAESVKSYSVNQIIIAEVAESAPVESAIAGESDQIATDSANTTITTAELESTPAEESAVLLKYDKNGKHIWTIRIITSPTPAEQKCGITSIVFDNNHNMYISATISTSELINNSYMTIEKTDAASTPTTPTTPTTLYSVDANRHSRLFFGKNSTAGVIMKFTLDTAIDWIASIDGADNDQINQIAVDTNNNVYVSASVRTNKFNSTMVKYRLCRHPNTENTITGDNMSALSISTSINTQALLIKLNTDGTIIWSVKADGSSEDFGKNILIGTDNSIYWSGTYNNSLSDIQAFRMYSTDGKYTTLAGNSPTSSTDLFMSKYTPEGILVWATKIGSTSNDDEFSKNMAIDSKNNVLVACNMPKLNKNTDISQNTAAGYLIKYTPEGRIAWLTNISGTASVKIGTIAVDSSDGVIAGLYFDEPTTDITNTNKYTILNSQGKKIGDIIGYSPTFQRDAFYVRFTSTGQHDWQVRVAAIDCSASYHTYHTIDKDDNIILTNINSQSSGVEYAIKYAKDSVECTYNSVMHPWFINNSDTTTTTPHTTTPPTTNSLKLIKILAEGKAATINYSKAYDDGYRCGQEARTPQNNYYTTELRSHYTNGVEDGQAYKAGYDNIIRKNNLSKIPYDMSTQKSKYYSYAKGVQDANHTNHTNHTNHI
jgi:hypothetical protein